VHPASDMQGAQTLLVHEGAAPLPQSPFIKQATQAPFAVLQSGVAPEHCEVLVVEHCAQVPFA